ncbi:unnamed protein product [Fraxinus pennsylvanica]|uniref:Uncharacterized protein n=1 Tax=Fraxinus pennsylvanica TaxID=56036 RepID=A0AAD1YWB7_9LAMI|nr:unnamed protein product [Fraxinus pennsylvanica]
MSSRLAWKIVLWRSWKCCFMQETCFRTYYGPVLILEMLASGHPYLQHCVEDCSFASSNWGKCYRCCVMISIVSKLSHLINLALENNTTSKIVEADHLHTMFLAMADARAVLIKLADRFHNMMTLDALPLIKQQIFAKETLEIFAPLAN